MRDLDAVVWAEFAAAVLMRTCSVSIEYTGNAEQKAKAIRERVQFSSTIADGMMVEFLKRFPEKK